MAGEGSSDFWRALLGFFLPPLAVGMQVGFGAQFVVNLVLMVLFFVPAQIHAMWVVATYRDDGSKDPEGSSKFVALLLSYFLPPISVFMRRGVGLDVVINIALCLLGVLPGQLHALYVSVSDSR